jgi:ketosteroid isomerase-like protein
MFEACNARDIDAVTAYFADDAVFDWFNGQRFEGKAAIRDIMATALGMIWVKI